MNTVFSLDTLLSPIDIQAPSLERRPVVGITANHQDIDITLRDRYCQQVTAAGGVAVVLPPDDDISHLLITLDCLDAIIFSGGADIDPRWMDEEPSPLLGTVNAPRDSHELLLARLAARRQMPMLGICRGMQTMAVALGGHVAQDMQLIADRHDPFICHDQKEEREVTTHEVTFRTVSSLAALYPSRSTIAVNSFHHQAVDRLPLHFRLAATGPDGTIEAMESSEEKPWMGVQWHPEWLGEEGAPLFRWLIREAALYRQAKALHRKAIVVDSHCDTPMFFPQGANIARRDSRVLVDSHKMTDGGVDAAVMVAYIPQPADGQTWRDVMPIDTPSPTAYADTIFDIVEEQVRASQGALLLAATPEQVRRNKEHGSRSIVLGIENALALGDDLRLVEHFRQRGAAYFTLCHNGDNQICDSARRSHHTWGGLSPFGREVVREMNRQGVMVDLSHAGEQSFYDAVELSAVPVVCSHSNCRAVCDHERNLTDDQLRRLAANGGVCQITLYEGFVASDPREADILRVMDHLDHAIRIMGEEHVGLGSDFDGDGGLRGLRDASEMMLFTRQLLLRRYSPQTIRLILGGNFMRLWEAATR